MVASRVLRIVQSLRAHELLAGFCRFCADSWLIRENYRRSSFTSCSATRAPSLARDDRIGSAAVAVAAPQFG